MRPVASPLLRKPFFRNKAIEQFAEKPSTPISLKHLINFGQHGRNKGEKEEAEKLIKGGNFLRTELPTRLSHRLRDLQSLPYIVTSHPRIERVYDMYLDAFERIRKFPHIKNLDDNDAFCAFMQNTLNAHRIVIPELAIGIAEASPEQLSPLALDNFMTRMLRSRISRRVVTEQHIALTAQFRHRQAKGKGIGGCVEIEDDRRVGVVDTRLVVADVINQCGELLQARGGIEKSVPLEMDGELDTSFAYIPEHLQFMIFELVKHATNATAERHGTDAPLHPVRITVVHGPKDLAVRITDEGGGIAPWGGVEPDDVAASFISSSPRILVAGRLDIFSFAAMRRLYLHHRAQDALATESTPRRGRDTGIMALRTLGSLEGTVQEQLAHARRREAGSEEEREALALMEAQTKSGIGLPLAKMFAEYFGGTLEIFSLMGEGSDAVLKIPKFGAAP